jgi:hypothetical protein
LQAFEFEIIAALVGLLALILFYVSFRILVGTSWLFGWLAGNLGIIFLLASGVLILLVLDIRSYQPMLEQKAVSTFSLTALSPQRYQLRLVDSKGGESAYDFEGDSYHLAINEFKWSPLFAEMGLDHGYRITSLISTRHQNKAVLTTPVSEPAYLDSWDMIRRFFPAEFFVQAEQELTDELPVVDGGIYEIFSDGYEINIRPLNRIARQAQVPATQAIETAPGQTLEQDVEQSMEQHLQQPERNEIVVDETSTTDVPEKEEENIAEVSDPDQDLTTVDQATPVKKNESPGAHLQATPAELIETLPADQN